MTFTIFTKKQVSKSQNQQNLSAEESFMREWDMRREMAATSAEREEIDAIFFHHAQMAS